MYRAAPNHLLFQGDIVIVPLISLPDTTIPIISNDGPLTAVCPTCNTEHPIPPLGPCNGCQRDLAVLRGRRVRPAAARRRDGEAPFDTAAGTQQVVAVAEVVAALILSHSCDIDTKDQVRFAPVRPLADRRFNAMRETIQRRAGAHAFFYLPATDRLPEAAACLNEAFNLGFAHLGDRRPFRSAARGPGQRALAPFVQVVDGRRASLDAEGLQRLYEANIKLDARPEAMEAALTPSATAFEDDPDRPQRAALPNAPWSWPVPHWLR